MEKNHTEDKLAYANDAVVRLSPEQLSAPCGTMRGGLPNSAATFLREKRGRVAFLGGSITQMQGWSNLLEEQLRRRFSEAHLDFVNAAIGGTNSTFGVFRFDDHVLAKGPVDLLFLEFAVNDSGDYNLANQRLQAMEGIIRKARQANPAMDILVLYFVDEAKVQDYRQQNEPLVITHHERIMNHYQIPVINLALEMTRRLDRALFAWSDFSGDSCHPTPFGHEQYVGCIQAFLAAAWAGDAAPVAPPKQLLPAPLCADHLALARLVDTRQAQGWPLVEGWLAEQVCNYSGPVDVLTATAPGETLTLPFDGRQVAISAIAGMDAGVLEISIDGGPVAELDLFDQYCGRFHRPVFQILAHGLPAGPHTLRLGMAERCNPESTGRAARILQFGVA